MIRSCRGRLLTGGIVCTALLTIWQLHLTSRLDISRPVLSYQNKVQGTNRSDSNSSRSSRSSINSSNSSRSSNNIGSWPDEQQSRKDEIQKACQTFREKQRLIEIQKRSLSTKRKGKGSPFTLKEELVQISHSRRKISNLYVDDVYKLIYCNVPNVSSEQWKNVMILLSGSKYNSVDEISHLTTHVLNNLTTLADKKYTPNSVLLRLETFSKVLTIRDPLERLLSAYRDKFAEDAPLSPLYHNMYGRNWIPFVRRDSNHTGTLQFDEMLEFFSRHSGPTEKFNGLWRPIFDLCHPCTIQYDFIANFTTQERDSNEILARVLQGTQKSGLRFPELKRSSTGESLKEILPTLDPKLVRDVQQKYYKDYDMFGPRRFT